MRKTGRFERLTLASKALLLNARVKVVVHITGLTRRELEKVFYDCPQFHVNPGRYPASSEWFVAASLIVAFHTAIFYSIFQAIVARDIPPGDALVAAYQKYQARFGHDLRIDFDRAFLLISFVDGHWTKDAPTLEAVDCRDCHGLYIGAVGEGQVRHSSCPLCKVASTFERSRRISIALAHPGLQALLKNSFNERGI